MNTSNGTWPLCVLSSIENNWRKEETNVPGSDEDIPDFKWLVFAEDEHNCGGGGGGGGGGARVFIECECWFAWICSCCSFIASWSSLGDETHLDEEIL